MNIRKRINDSVGVSPVIATILMVAITVVLAAVLYLMVSNFTNTGGGGTEPIVSLSINDPMTGDNQTINVASTSRSERMDSYYLLLLHNDTNVDIMDPLRAATPSDNGYFTYLDINDNERLDGGDKINVDMQGLQGDWELILYWKSSNQKITSITFSS